MCQSAEQNLDFNRSLLYRPGKAAIHKRYNAHLPKSYFKKVLFQIRYPVFFIGLLFMANNMVWAQIDVISKEKFFSDESLIEMSIVADFNSLIKEKLREDFKQGYLPAIITCLFHDSIKVTEAVQIRPRGKYRREECIMPPLMVNFKTSTASTLKKLGQLKLVWPCGGGHYEEQLILKEFLAYKIYNLLTEKSFRVRLVRMSFHDTKEKIKPRTFYAYFMEDVGEMAGRNKCKEIQPVRLNTSQTNRELTTLVTLFEYMIGNCDWAIPILRNVKLMRSKTDSLSKPFVVPYDFDYSGLVYARYAIPPEDLPITSVLQRYYLGFERTMEELQSALQLFRNQRATMDSLIKNFEPLDESNKKEMTKYLDEFFKTTEKEKDIRELFINNARKE